MKLKIYQIDAFADEVFRGNPAAVVPLQAWPDDILMQRIAAENNLAETAYFIPEKDGHYIRWFTPKAEVDLCGHATMATAYVLFELLGFKQQQINFNSRSGILTVTKNENWYTLNFPADTITPTPLTDELQACFNITATEAWLGKMDYMLVFKNRKDIEDLQPDLMKIAVFDKRGIIATAPGTSEDFVSRYFAPAYGINEDPVTGSAHTTLTPYWSSKLNKTTFTARQLSARGGFLKCKLLHDRVEISGQVAHYLTGEIFV